MLFQINHSLLGTSGGGDLEVVGLVATAKIYSLSSLFDDLYIPINSLSIINRAVGSDGYISINSPTSRLNISDITERIAGNVLLKIYSKTANGELYAIQALDYEVSDFRYDLGVKNATYTLVMRDDFSSPPNTNIILDSYSSKKKLNSQSATVGKYVYTVNPNDYRYYSVGVGIIEGNLSGTITEVALLFSNTSVKLTIETEVIV